ncbi:MAG: PAS domain S-box protein, partial [Gemmatimonadota bacterium]|nr:PAS domain S-box protein [Gemmatimonadota bacterium]
ALEQTRTTYGYKQVVLFDAAARLIAPANTQIEADERRLIEQVIASKRSVVSPMRVDSTGVLEFGALHPVFAEGDSTKAVVGAVALVHDATTRLLPLLRQVQGELRGAESVLGQLEGDSIAVIAATRTGASLTPLHRRVPLANRQFVAVLLYLSDGDGVVRGADYRGVPVVAAGRRIDGAPWIIMTKVETTALRQAVQPFALLAAITALVLITLSATVMRVMWLMADRRASSRHFSLASRYLAATTSSIDGYVLLDSQGRLLDVNATLEKMTGYTRAELLQRSLADLKADLPSADVPAWLALLAERRSARFQSQWRRADGSLLDIDVSTSYLGEAEGGQLFSFVRDITEQIKTTNRLERLNTLYFFLNRSSEALFATRSVEEAYETVCRMAVADGRFRLAWVGVVDEPAGVVRPVAWAGAATDYVRELRVTLDPSLPTSQGPTGRCIRDARAVVVNDFPSNPQTAPWHPLAAANELGSSMALPVVVDGAVVAAVMFYAGRPGFFDVEMTAMLGEISRLLGLVVQTAASEQRRQEEEDRRRRSEERFRRLFEASPMPMYVQHETSGKITRLNRAFTELFGYTLEDIPSTTEQMAAFYPDASYREALNALFLRDVDDASRDGSPVRSPDLRVRCKDGSYRAVQGFVSRAADELILGWIDVTEVRANQEILQDAEQIAKLGSWSHDFRTNQIRTSDDFLGVLGLNPELRDAPTPAGEPWLMNLFHPNDRPRMLEAFRRTAEVDEVIRAATPNDATKFLRVRVRVEVDATGPLRAVGSMQDVTQDVLATAELSRLRDHLQEVVDERTAELERANATLQMTDKRLKAMFDMSQKAATLDEQSILQLGIDEATRLTSSTVGYVHLVSDDQQQIQFGTWATGTRELVQQGHEAHYAVGEQGLWADAVRRRETVLHNEFAGASVRANYPVDHVTLQRHLVVPVVDGDRVRLLLGVGNKDAAYDGSDVQELQLIGHDIWSVVQRRRADIALEQAYQWVRASDQRFAFAMEASSEGVWEWDIAHGTLSFNDPYARMLGYEPGEMARTEEAWRELLHPDERDRVSGELRLALTTDAPYANEFRLRAKDGSYRWVLARGRVLDRDEQRRALRAVGTHLDLTARRQAEDELRAAKEQADAASRAKSAFLAVMSHEIRTPLNGVIAMAEILAQSPLAPNDMDALQTIQASANALLAVIDDILDFSKIEAGGMEIDLADISLLQLSEDLCESLLPLARARDVDLHLFVAPDLPLVTRSDPTRVRQILYNLTGNAIKFSAGRPLVRGHVALRVEALPGATSRVRFLVQDNGIGMSPETIDRLFTSFTQGEVSTTRKFGGTGLGLAITKRLVEMMNGQIDVQSALGAGSTFSVTLPLEVIDEHASVTPHDLSGVHCIILAGDPALPTSDLARLLTFAGATTELAADAATAADAARNAHGPCVALHVTSDDRFTIDATFSALPELRHVALTRGRRTRPRIHLPNVVSLDCDLLRARRVLRAVAVAIGRASPEVFYDDDTPAPQVERPRAITVDEARAQGRLILVAEDDRTNQKVILQQLALLGHAAELAENGAEALRRWREGRYALLLSDLHMPEMDGYSLTRAIRAEESAPVRLPIVALTANALRGEAARAEAAGMDGYLTKPVPLATLRELVDRFIPPIASEALAASVTPTATSDASPLDSTSPDVSADVPVAPSLLDVSVLAALVGDEPAVLREFLGDFQQSVRALHLEMRAARDEGNLSQVASIAHRLKSSSRSVGAIPLGSLCADLEQAGKRGDGALVTELGATFDTLWPRVDATITDYLTTA